MQLSYGSTPRSKLAEALLGCPEAWFLVAGFWLLVSA
jgi:hypothetical protein